MKSALAVGTCTAAILTFALAAYAQTTGQSSAQPPGQSSSQPTAQVQSSDQQTTIVGCVQREGDYRRAQGAGHGGAAGTGIGAGNEFVLINASILPSGATSSSPRTGTDTAAGTVPSSTSTGTAGTTSGTATGAPGTAAGMPSTTGSPSATTGTTGAATATAYELTGPGEGQLQQYVGRRVEIVGRFKSGQAPQGASGAATGTTTPSTGAQSSTSTAGKVSDATKGGTDIMGQDLNLPEFEVVTVREASGTCPAAPDRR